MSGLTLADQGGALPQVHLKLIQPITQILSPAVWPNFQQDSVKSGML